MAPAACEEPEGFRRMAQGPDLALVFDLGGDLYALPAADVFKVVELGTLSILPRLPDAIRGISHHRGRVITVVDMARLMGGVQVPIDGKNRLVLLEKGGRNVGLLTGPVEEIVPLDPSTGNPPGREGGLVVRLHLHRGKALNALSTERLLQRIYGLCKPDTVAPVRRALSVAPVMS
ncbi:MAG: chemotaxis protein CheW [Myxococcota bacterium]